MPWQEILDLVLRMMESRPAKRLFNKLTSRRARKRYVAIILLLLIVLLSMEVIIAARKVFRNLLIEAGKKQFQTQQQIENLNQETAQLHRRKQDAARALDALQLQGETLLSRLDTLRDEHAKELHSRNSSAGEMVPAKQNHAPEVTESFSPEPLAKHTAFDRALLQRHVDLVDLITANSDSAGNEPHAELIRQELVKHNATLADLYAKHVERTPGLKGYVKIRFRIDARGFLTMPHVIANGLKPEAAAARFIEEIQHKMSYWKDFPVTTEYEKTFYLATYQFGSEP